MKATEIHRIDGVGIDLGRFQPCWEEQLKVARRRAFGFDGTDFIVTVVAEVNRNKNQMALVRVVPILQARIPRLRILLIGRETEPDVRRYVETRNLSDVVLFLGYRNDVEKILSISDVGFSASFREGLPVNIIESMACGLPILCSDNRGHRSLVSHLETGLMFRPDDSGALVDYLVLLHKNPALRREMGQRNVAAVRRFSLGQVLPRMQEIYTEMMEP